MRFNEQYLREGTYNFGKEIYTDKNMTPDGIQSLAFAYAQTPIKSYISKKTDTLIKSFTDLKRLIGMDFDYNSKKLVKSTKPALIVHLLKNQLVTKDEYIQLYKSLITKSTEISNIISKVKDSTKGSASASRVAKRDMKGEFDTDENINR